MGNQYNLTVKNQSGSSQTYSLFQKKPDVSPNAQVWSTAVQSSGAPQGAQSRFHINSDVHAVVGTASGRLANGVPVYVQNSIPVTLGNKNKDGSAAPGSSVKLVVDSETQTPNIVGQPQNGGQFNCFDIATSSYNRQDALDGNWIVGVGTNPDGGDVKPTAVIFPEPNKDYQFQTVNVWTVVAQKFNVGSLVDSNSLGNAVQVDFAKLQSNSVTVIHSSDGSMTVQA